MIADSPLRRITSPAENERAETERGKAGTVNEWRLTRTHHGGEMMSKLEG